MSQYMYYEYQAVHYSLGFWKELMQRNLDADAINLKGVEISKSLHII